MRKDVEDILDKYKDKLGNKFDKQGFSREYKKFKLEGVDQKASFYENMCNFSEKILKISVAPEKRVKEIKNIERAGLRITPEGANSFSILTGIFFILLGILIFVLSFLLGNIQFFFSILMAAIGLISIKVLIDKPKRVAFSVRLSAENQMVLCILYVVMYMRHTSNLEHAVKFAALHLDEPLSTDLKRVFWHIEIGRYNTLKESLDAYLEEWKEHDIHFVNAFHLVESSLYEPTEARRLEILDRGLNTILDGTYENMLHFAHDLKTPITTLYMLGIILPILGLIVLPLVGSFLGVKWYWLAFVYNILFPIGVYVMAQNMLVKRPGSEAAATGLDKGYENERKLNLFGGKVNAGIIAGFILFFILLIGFSPVLIHAIDPGSSLNETFGYLNFEGGFLGPFGLIALIISLFVPLGVALGMGTYYKIRAKKLIKVRNNVKNLEKEFAGSLFQLGNRIEDGVPTELAFSKVSENTKGTLTGDFFNTVSENIGRLGMDIRSALFHKKRGALNYYPSKILRSSMEVLVESSSKGPKIAAHSLISISNYMSNVHKVNERLKDLLADVLSSIKGQINFLTPLIAGIVVGIGSMITTVVASLGTVLGGGLQGGEIEGFGIDLSILTQVFPIDKLIPPYFFQLVVGIYLIQVTYILTKLANSVEFGVDKVNEEYEMSKNLYRSMIFYFIVTVVVSVILNFMAKGVGNVASGI